MEPVQVAGSALGRSVCTAEGSCTSTVTDYIEWTAEHLLQQWSVELAGDESDVQ